MSMVQMFFCDICFQYHQEYSGVGVRHAKEMYDNKIRKISEEDRKAYECRSKKWERIRQERKLAKLKGDEHGNRK